MAKEQTYNWKFQSSVQNYDYVIISSLMKIASSDVFLRFLVEARIAPKVEGKFPATYIITLGEKLWVGTLLKSIVQLPHNT